MKQRVVIGMSGGVDSAVSAWLLKEAGYDVVGLFMKNWEDDDDSEYCSSRQDFLDAASAADVIGIDLEAVNFAKEYKERVFSDFLREYSAGRTPNPDVLCNAEIKFAAFLDHAMRMGAEKIATGHYARVRETERGFELLRGLDAGKDQSYFLCQLSQEQLAAAMFPIGDMLKPEVRRVATELNLVTAHKKDSQGICFVGKVDLPVFLQQKLKAEEGKGFLMDPEAPIFRRDWAAAYADSPDPAALEELATPYPLHPKYGRKVGTHQGAQFYTIGQRKGLFIGGFPEPLFVIGNNIEHNQVFVGMGEGHPGLYRRVLKIKTPDVHWLRDELQMADGETRAYKCRIRYRQPLQDVRALATPDGMFIVFAEPQRGITPGQFAALYDGDEVVCSGVIAM